MIMMKPVSISLNLNLKFFVVKLPRCKNKVLKCIFIDSRSRSRVRMKDETPMTLSQSVLNSTSLRHSEFVFLLFCFFLSLALNNAQISIHVSIERPHTQNLHVNSTFLMYWAMPCIVNLVAFFLFLYTKATSFRCRHHVSLLPFCFVRSFVRLQLCASLLLNYCLWIQFLFHSLLPPNSLQTCFLHFRLGIRILCFLPPSKIHCVFFS